MDAARIGCSCRSCGRSFAQAWRQRLFLWSASHVTRSSWPLVLSNRAIRALPAAASPCINGAGVPRGKRMPVGMPIVLPPLIVTLVANRPQLHWTLG